MLDFSFTEEQDLFREAIKEWLAKNLPMEKVRENDTNHELPKDIIKGLGDLGLLCMTLPEEHGGVGGLHKEGSQRRVLHRDWRHRARWRLRCRRLQDQPYKRRRSLGSER